MLSAKMLADDFYASPLVIKVKLRLTFFYISMKITTVTKHECEC